MFDQHSLMSSAEVLGTLLVDSKDGDSWHGSLQAGGGRPHRWTQLVNVSREP